MYDGKIYQNRETFALKFKSGAFHYVEENILIEAFNQDFIIGSDVRVYENMPWGMQHTGYRFEANQKLRDKFICEVYRNFFMVKFNYYASWLDKMYISRDDASLEIGFNLSDSHDPFVICYWNSDEWLEDAESVVPAMMRAQELFYTNKKILLSSLGYIVKD